MCTVTVTEKLSLLCSDLVGHIDHLEDTCCETGLWTAQVAK